MPKENPNDLAGMFAEKYLQGKSYDFVIETARYLKKIAETSCKLPILTEES
ncbi:hypothetical protein ACM55F_13320 [Flavobacterium sp. XS2P12]|uniref:hypothetical protein n=1 Tax=Flavobacterium melibiosi TaxID=3398734 RepID=UPI003A8AD723